MRRRKQLDLRAKLLQETEMFLNRALETSGETNHATVSSENITRIIEGFSRRVWRLTRLKSLRPGRQKQMARHKKK